MGGCAKADVNAAGRVDSKALRINVSYTKFVSGAGEVTVEPHDHLIEKSLLTS
jgi:hypothetical protein